MALRKDQTIYTGAFRNLKLQAFGFGQIIREAFTITIHQITCRPARWAARPQLSHGGHAWEGPTAQTVMDLVAADFEECISPFTPEPDRKGARPSLRSAADVAGDRKQA